MLMKRDAQHRLHMVCTPGADCDAAAEAAKSDQSFLRSAWFEASAADTVSTLLALRSDATPIAALPLVPRKFGRLTAREVPGSYWPFRSVPIAADATGEELTSLIASREARAALGPVWRLGPVFEGDMVLQRLAPAAEGAGWTVLRRVLGTCFEIDVLALTAQGPWPRGSSMKKNRWREKKLAELGTLSFRSFTARDWTDADRDAIASVETNSWLAAEPGAGTQFHDLRQRRIWERVSLDPVLGGMLSGTILSVGGIPAAFSFGLDVGRTRYQIANNYDERFGQHSPGKTLLMREFEAFVARGIERISWGSGDAGYKTDMGARPGPQILDLLFVRSPLLALPLKRHWTRSAGG